MASARHAPGPGSPVARPQARRCGGIERGATQAVQVDVAPLTIIEAESTTMADTDLITGPDLGKPDRRGLLKSMAALPLFVSPAAAAVVAVPAADAFLSLSSI